MPIRPLIFLAACLAPLASAALVPERAPQGGLSVVGEGVVRSAPAVAWVDLGVEVADASLAEAQRAASERLRALVSKLRELGVAPEDVQTTSYSVQPLYGGADPPALRGHRVSSSIAVRVRSVSQVGRIIDEAIGAGASRVEGVRFEPEDPEALARRARALAMEDAQEKAEQLARLGGVSLGRPVLIESAEPPIGIPRAALPVEGAAQTPIEPGELEYRATVHVVFAIR